MMPEDPRGYNSTSYGNGQLIDRLGASPGVKRHPCLSKVALETRIQGLQEVIEL